MCGELVNMDTWHVGRAVIVLGEELVGHGNVWRAS